MIQKRQTPVDASLHQTTHSAIAILKRGQNTRQCPDPSTTSRCSEEFISSDNSHSTKTNIAEPVSPKMLLARQMFKCTCAVLQNDVLPSGGVYVCMLVDLLVLGCPYLKREEREEDIPGTKKKEKETGREDSLQRNGALSAASNAAFSALRSRLFAVRTRQGGRT